MTIKQHKTTSFFYTFKTVNNNQSGWSLPCLDLSNLTGTKETETEYRVRQLIPKNGCQRSRLRSFRATVSQIHMSFRQSTGPWESCLTRTFPANDMHNSEATNLKITQAHKQYRLLFWMGHERGKLPEKAEGNEARGREQLPPSKRAVRRHHGIIGLVEHWTL